MHVERKVTLDQNKGKIVQILCSQCLRATDHEILNSVTNDFSIDEETNQGWYESYWAIIYEVVECRGCHDISFRRSLLGDDDEDSGEHIYPPRLSSRKKLINNHGLGPIPDHIYKVYEEVYQARCNEQFVLCGAGLRILLELICKKIGATGTCLDQYIVNLEKNTLCSASDAIILKGIKLFGNEVTHEASIDVTELDAAFDVLEHMLNLHFVLKEKTKKLTDRVDQKKIP